MNPGRRSADEAGLVADVLFGALEAANIERSAQMVVLAGLAASFIAQCRPERQAAVRRGFGRAVTAMLADANERIDAWAGRGRRSGGDA